MTPAPHRDEPVRPFHASCNEANPASVCPVIYLQQSQLHQRLIPPSRILRAPEERDGLAERVLCFISLSESSRHAAFDQECAGMGGFVR